MYTTSYRVDVYTRTSVPLPCREPCRIRCERTFNVEYLALFAGSYTCLAVSDMPVPCVYGRQTVNRAVQSQFARCTLKRAASVSSIAHMGSWAHLALVPAMWLNAFFRSKATACFARHGGIQQSMSHLCYEHDVRMSVCTMPWFMYNY